MDEMEAQLVRKKKYYSSTGKPKDLVMKLITGLEGSGRNVTMDRYYTSVDLVEELCATHNLTVVGTIKPNSRGLPEEVKEAGGREEQSSVLLEMTKSCSSHSCQRNEQIC